VGEKTLYQEIALPAYASLDLTSINAVIALLPVGICHLSLETVQHYGGREPVEH
jgi:hypothetical protein